MHVHSAAAKLRILRVLPGVLSDARLASGADCATAEAAVRHHNLLCETFEDGSDAAAHHAAAVDVYLTHLESLAVPHANAHAKVAACVLLAQACLECAPRRFVASLGRWGAALGKLADGADRHGAPSPSARAALRALAAMARRASAMMDVPGVRKESATVAQKTAAAALRWLERENERENERERAEFASALLFADAPGGVVHDSIDAIAVCLESHPAALRPKVDAIETALVRVLLESPMGSSLAVARAARALARLPRAGAAAGNAGASSGIADPRSAFSQQMRRVLIALHAELDGGLRNMETASGDAFAKQARTALVPAGSAAPPALGGDEKKKSFQTKKESRAETHLDRATRLFSLLACVFRAPFPSAAGVAVPADLVLGAVRRALAADGAGVAAAPGLPATAAPAEALAALPAAHAAACDALAALLEAGGAANARLAGPVARALDGVLRAGATPALNRGSGSDASGKRGGGGGGGDARPGATCATTRAAAYRVAAAAARALGPASAAGELALFVVPHAASDAVFGWGSRSHPGSVDENRTLVHEKKSLRDAVSQRRPKKNPRGSGGAWGRAGADEMDAYLASGGLVDRRGGLAGGGVGSAADTVREAALDALEAIVTSGGAMLPAGVRTLADAAAAEAASRAFLAVCSSVGSGSGMLEARVPAAVRARRAAYALLLASTLAPRPFRATNLPLAASLFRAATLRDPALSNEAARAALAVEALLHPAAPPLHPRAIAPPRDFGLADIAHGGFGDEVYGGDKLGGATWGGDARDTQRRAAPAWGDAAPAPDVSSEEAEGASDDDAAAGDDAAASPSGASLPPAVAPTKRGDPERTKPAKRESSPPASPRGAKTAKRSEAEGEGVPVEGVPVEGVPEPAAPAGRASRSRAAPVPKPAPEPKPKRQTAKEKAAAAKAAKAEAAAAKEAAAQAAAAASKPKSVGLGLGSGKSSVALALSESDSDGELPEIVDE